MTFLNAFNVMIKSFVLCVWLEMQMRALRETL
jgi:hypothetical protein